MGFNNENGSQIYWIWFWWSFLMYRRKFSSIDFCWFFMTPSTSSTNTFINFFFQFFSSQAQTKKRETSASMTHSQVWKNKIIPTKDEQVKNNKKIDVCNCQSQYTFIVFWDVCFVMMLVQRGERVRHVSYFLYTCPCSVLMFNRIYMILDDIFKIEIYWIGHVYWILALE